MKKEISTLLRELGISPDLSGFHYLKEAIQMVWYDETLLHNNVTKVLYPTVAKKFKTTAMRVERGMRHAIEKGTLRTNIDLVRDIFGNTISPYSNKPTNSQFIGCVVEYLLMQELSEIEKQ